jgi:copper chaperone CopZ
MLLFRVPDMHCEGCIRSLTGALRDVDPSATLQADLTTKQVQVTSSAPAASLADAMRDAGFDVEPG